MHLIALLCTDPRLAKALTQLHAKIDDKTDDDSALPEIIVHHVIPKGALREVFAGLAPLGFAGALCLSEGVQQEALAAAQQSTLDAKEVAVADAVSVTPLGLVADYTLGRAVGGALLAAGWDARRASAVILGEGARARAVSRELASLGVQDLSVLSPNRPTAEQTGAQLAASTRLIARSLEDPVAKGLIARADLLVRVEPTMRVLPELLGPHLSVVDLSPEAMSTLRQQAVGYGALALGLRDIQAQQLSACLGHILGWHVGAEPFLQLLHQL